MVSCVYQSSVTTMSQDLKIDYISNATLKASSRSYAPRICSTYFENPVELWANGRLTMPQVFFFLNLKAVF